MKEIIQKIQEETYKNRAGKRQYPAHLKQELIEVFENSKMTRATFCSKTGLHISTLDHWLRRTKRKQQAKCPAQPHKNIAISIQIDDNKISYDNNTLTVKGKMAKKLLVAMMDKI